MLSGCTAPPSPHPALAAQGSQGQGSQGFLYIAQEDGPETQEAGDDASTLLPARGSRLTDVVEGPSEGTSDTHAGLLRPVAAQGDRCSGGSHAMCAGPRSPSRLPSRSASEVLEAGWDRWRVQASGPPGAPPAAAAATIGAPAPESGFFLGAAEGGAHPDAHTMHSNPMFGAGPASHLSACQGLDQSTPLPQVVPYYSHNQQQQQQLQQEELQGGSVPLPRAALHAGLPLASAAPWGLRLGAGDEKVRLGAGNAQLTSGFQETARCAG